MSLQKILVIEDEPIVLRSLSAFLIQGYEVLNATNGEEGYKMILQEKPDLVLLDLVLPKMHGFEILKKMKEEKSVKGTPVIVLSNMSAREDINKSFDLGAADYLIKEQVNFEIIRHKIELVLTATKKMNKKNLKV